MTAKNRPRSFQWGTLPWIAMNVCCGFASTLQVKETEHGIRAEIRTLGEYPGTFTSVKVRDMGSGEVVWLVKGNPTLQVHNIELRSGHNAAVPEEARMAQVLVPSGAASFDLKPGANYEFEVCFKESSNSCETKVFHVR